MFDRPNPPPPPTTPGPSPKTRAVQMSIAAAAALLVPLWLVYFLLTHGGPKDPYSFGSALGRIACFYFGIAGLAAGVQRVFRSRSGWPATIVFVVLMLGFAGLFTAGAVRASRRIESARLWRAV